LIRDRTTYGAPAPASATSEAANWIQFVRGRVSIQTTERYLGCKQKLRIGTRLLVRCVSVDVI
jgi:hypothetical protein